MAIIQKSFSDLVDFTRASTATYTDAMGVIRTAAIDEPRFTYDPVTGESLGLLLEPFASTNFVEFSESTFAHTTPAVVVYDYSSSPSGMIDATLIYGDSANVYARPQGQQTLMSGQDYVASVFCKPMGVNSSRAAVWLPGSVFNDSASGNGPQCRINPDGSIETWGDPDRYGVEELADGWYRVWVSHSAIHTAIPSNLMRFWPIFARSDPEDGWLFWGMQMEEGSIPSSYIPTAGSQVTRAGDSGAVLNGQAFKDVFNPHEGVLIIDVMSHYTTGSGSRPKVFGFGDGDYNNAQSNSMYLSQNQDGRYSLRRGVTNLMSTLSTNQRIRLGLRWGDGVLSIFVDGDKLTDSVDISDINMNEFTELSFGAEGYPYAFSTSIYRNFQLYSGHLSDAQLAALTEVSE